MTQTSQDQPDALFDTRLRKADAMREAGSDPFANDFVVDTSVLELFRRYAEIGDREALATVTTPHALAGRVMAVNVFGKAAFIRIQDRTVDDAAQVPGVTEQDEPTGRLQVFVSRDALGEEAYAAFKKQLDIGDFVGVVGTPMRTKTGELSVHAKELRILSKALRPLPEKWHGLSDKETRYRQRYLDLIVNPESRKAFRTRARILSYLRRFFEERDFIEVETPMMQAIAGGAAARPFVTHHNALDMDLYLRIAPELYLKRLVVGGFERVFEINRNFRNEGLSTMHNPEFTMLEFYQAYATYEHLMDMGEDLLGGCAAEVLGGDCTVTWMGHDISLAPPYRRMTMLEAIAEHGGPAPHEAVDAEKAGAALKAVGIDPEGMGPGKRVLTLFEHFAEPKLIQPTFIYDFPLEVSPLARKKPSNPTLVDRFELFVGGKELANAFSELNDPVDQRGRFEAQLAEREKGDQEAHAMDEDYVRALEHGMPPAGGFGLGIDRLAMLLSGQSSIRDVILFPLLRATDG